MKIQEQVNGLYIEEIQNQIGSIHTDELRSGHQFTYAFNGKLGYGDSALDAVNDAGCVIADNGSYQYADADFPFVSQCWDSEGEETGLLFKW